MKNILKKYFELDEESKEILPFLYMYQELLSAKDNYKNIKIESMADEELLMQTIIKCWYSTNLDASNIVDKLLSILDCQDITIKDLVDLSIEELQEIVCDEEITENPEIILEFVYKKLYCIFCKSNEQYFLIINKDENADIITFDKFEDILKPFINKYIKDNFLYGKSKDYE